MTRKSLAAVISEMPATWATCPIYRKGVELPNGSQACGKSPLGRAHHDNLSPAASGVYIDTQPETFGAIGVFTGARSGGLVILDVDANLAALNKKWGKDLDTAPRIDSPKKNAAKFLFYVPQEHWGEVTGVSLAASKEGYEILWGRQGVVFGAYHSGGSYTYKGELSAVPTAPDWLLGRMQLAYQEAQSKTAAKKSTDTRYSRRTREEVVAIADACLSVIPAPGRGSEDLWWRIGAMLHSELPGEEGLNLWRQWSLKDEEYADDWSDGKDPCLDRWNAGFSGGGLGFGSLVNLADHHDPARARLKQGGLDVVVAEIEASPVRAQNISLSFDEVISRARAILELDNPAQINFELNALALQVGYRDHTGLERLVVSQLQYEKKSSQMSVQTLLRQDYKRDYLIPEVLPTPCVALIYGSGGDGKSMSAWTLAKHIALGLPFVVRGRFMPVKQGPVLLLNGDQPLAQLQEQLEEVEFPPDAPVTIQSDWSIERYAQFVRLMERIKPRLVVIDSLIGCSGGKAFDENKSEFATPLYWLTRNNGVLFPPTTILIVHHANKQGGFRGTSAIRDAVDEVWQLRKPSQEELQRAGEDARVITIEKSRSGRSGAQLLMKQEQDLTFRITDWTPEQRNGDTRPGGITDKVLARLRVVHPAVRTRQELNTDPLIGGNVAGIRKSLQRLEKRGLIESVDLPPTKKGGAPEKVYKAVLSPSTHTLSRGGAENPSHWEHFPSAAREEQWDTCPKNEDVSHCSSALERGTTEAMGHPPADKGECPIANPSPGQGSASNGTVSEYSRAYAREDRCAEELQAAADSAWDMWATKPMSQAESLETVGDMQRCIDVSAEEI